MNGVMLKLNVLELKWATMQCSTLSTDGSVVRLHPMLFAYHRI